MGGIFTIPKLSVAARVSHIRGNTHLIKVDNSSDTTHQVSNLPSTGAKCREWWNDPY